MANLPSIAVRLPFDQYATTKGPGYFAVDQNSRTSEVMGWTDMKVGAGDPKWRDKVAKGVDATNDYRMRRTDYVGSAATAQYIVRIGGLDYTMTSRLWGAGYHPINPATASSELRDIALARLKRRIANTTQSYQALVPIGELRDLRMTTRVIVDETMNLLRFVLDLRRQGRKGLVKRVGDAYLTWSFGIAPMLRDQVALRASLDKYFQGHPLRDKVVGTATKSWVSTHVNTGVTGGYLTTITQTTRMEHLLSYRFTAGWSFKILNSTNYTVGEHLGFTPRHFVPTIYQLLPWSWLVDYFTTCGDWLEDSFIGTSGQSIYVVENRKYVVKSSCSYDHQPMSGYTYRWLYRKPGWTDIRLVDFQRTRLTGLPARVLRWKNSDEIGLNALGKLLNLVALMASQRK